jgi:hypothetical protein
MFQVGLGLTIGWLFFYYLAAMLLGLPDTFHEGAFWDQGWW